MTSRLVLVLVVLGGLMPIPALAQTSELYLNDWSTPATFVVQNGAIVRQFSRSSPSDGPGMAVTETIKCIGQDGGEVGQEYDLDGAPLAGRYTNPGFDSLYDGATDGDRNWSVAHNDFGVNFAVVQGDADWNGVAVLFEPQRRSSGITFDANTGTLWLTNNVGSSDRIQQYDLDGNLLSEFAVQIPGGYGIAWDAADDTLWIPGAFGTSDLFQYDKDGTLLQRISVPGLTTQILGAEFAFGGARCTYTVKKSKSKRGCDACPAVGDDYKTQESCENAKDCRKKVKTTLACPGGGNGICKIKAKSRRCE